VRHFLAQAARVVAGFGVFFLCSGIAFSQTPEAKVQVSVHGGLVLFEKSVDFETAVGYGISSSLRVSKRLHVVARGGFIPAHQEFPAPVGALEAEVRLIELALGAKLTGPRFFASKAQPFFQMMGGALFYRPRPVNVPIGFGGVIKVEPPNATKPLLAAGAGVEWQLTRSIGLSLGIEASLTPITARFIDGNSREKCRPYYSAAIGITGSIK